MQLKLIPHDTCPTCGSITVAESCRNRHCNGQGFEERSFACGSVIRWSPNFERLETTTPCPKSPEAIEKKTKLNDLFNKLKSVVDASEFDESFKERVWHSFNFLTYN